MQTLKKLSTVLNLPISYLGCFEELPETTLAQKIYKARLYQGLTKKELAKQLGLDVKTITNWESGKTKPIKNLKPLVEKFISTTLCESIIKL